MGQEQSMYEKKQEEDEHILHVHKTSRGPGICNSITSVTGTNKESLLLWWENDTLESKVLGSLESYGTKYRLQCANFMQSLNYQQLQ